MWFKKANRIADLEARLEVAQRPRRDAALATDDPEARRLRAELRQTRTTLRTTEVQLGDARRQVAQLITRLGEYADQAIANGQRAERNRAAWRSARRRALPGTPVYDELWSLLDWSMWGAGMGDVLREPLADAMTAAISDRQRADALRIMKWWTEDRGRKPVGRWAYEDEKRRIARLRRACARYRADLAEQRAVVARQGEQLFDAIGYQPAERERLDLPVAAAPEVITP